MSCPVPTRQARRNNKSTPRHTSAVFTAISDSRTVLGAANGTEDSTVDLLYGFPSTLRKTALLHLVGGRTGPDRTGQMQMRRNSTGLRNASSSSSIVLHPVQAQTCQRFLQTTSEFRMFDENGNTDTTSLEGEMAERTYTVIKPYFIGRTTQVVCEDAAILFRTLV